jgi:putative transposase
MLPDRTHARLQGYDYSLPGAYFITICSSDRRPRFGKIFHGEVRLSTLGAIIEQHWQTVAERYGGRVRLDKSVIMPNHFHGLLILGACAPPLGQIVGGFKSGAARDWNRQNDSAGEHVFQTRFHDHVVRHEPAFRRIQEYIVNNPLQWTIDKENPKRTGENEFYRWIEAYSRKVALLSQS